MNTPRASRPPVVGRLAPSPTGKLHAGNLSSLLLAWAQARSAGGRLLLRVEDVDGPRVVAGAVEGLIDDLHWLGIEWDEGPDVGGPNAPYVQSERDAWYNAALERLARLELVYPCACSRKDVAEALSAPHGAFEPLTQYPGTCAHRTAGDAVADAAVRFRASGIVRVLDEVAGLVEHDVARLPGDFVVRRRDNLFAYQLAVVVDDGTMGVTDVVRGRDLLESAPRQVALHRALGFEPPRFWHVPMLVDSSGERLSKRAAATARDGLTAVGYTPELLRGALACLWGWRDRLGPISPSQLVDAFSVDQLRRGEIRVPDSFFAGPAAFAASLRTGSP